MARRSRKRTHKQFVQDQGELQHQQDGYDHNDETFNGFDSTSHGEGDATLDVTTRPEGAPEGVHHYQHANEVPDDIQSYFYQRYKIFPLYDDGIWMTDKAWYGVTQEAVANKIATHIAAARDDSRVIAMDIMCGAGGNTIAFAKSGLFQRTYGFEMDPATLSCAQHNARVYGVDDKITWFEGDCFANIANNDGLKVMAKEFSVIFCSPPWGGPVYRNQKIFDLEAMEPYSIRKLYTELSKLSDHIVLYLPRTSDLRQIAELVEDGKKVNVIHYCTGGSSRALCVYFGPFKFDSV